MALEIEVQGFLNIQKNLLIKFKIFVPGFPKRQILKFKFKIFQELKDDLNRVRELRKKFNQI